jgi:hypothetical protein
MASGTPGRLSWSRRKEQKKGSAVFAESDSEGEKENAPGVGKRRPSRRRESTILAGNLSYQAGLLGGRTAAAEISVIHCKTRPPPPDLLEEESEEESFQSCPSSPAEVEARVGVEVEVEAAPPAMPARLLGPAQGEGGVCLSHVLHHYRAFFYGPRFIVIVFHCG